MTIAFVARVGVMSPRACSWARRVRTASTCSSSWRSLAGMIGGRPTFLFSRLATSAAAPSALVSWRAAAHAVGLDPGALAKVDLQLLAGLALHAPEWQSGGGAQLAREAFHRLLTAREGVLGDQIMEDALCGQAGHQAGLDRRAQLHAQAAPAGGGVGWRAGGCQA